MKKNAVSYEIKSGMVKHAPMLVGGGIERTETFSAWVVATYADGSVERVYSCSASFDGRNLVSPVDECRQYIASLP